MKLITIQNRDRLYEYIQAKNLKFLGTRTEVELVGINSKDLTLNIILTLMEKNTKERLFHKKLFSPKATAMELRQMWSRFNLTLHFF